MKKTYLYRAFDLTLASELPINNLMPSNRTPDVEIAFGKTPKTIDNAIIKTDVYQAANGQFLLTVEGLARYYVHNGRHILIEPEGNRSFNDIAAYLLGTVFGALLFQRGLLPLHGSTVNMNGSAVVFAGKSGHGKSTLTRALFQRGHSFLNDDLTAIAFSDDGAAGILPSYPQQKLWDDSLEKMAVPKEGNSLIKVLDEMDKYSVPSKEYFYDRPLKPAHIYELNPCSEAAVRIERTRGADKADIIMKNTYIPFLPHGLDISERYFFQCINLAEQTLVSRIFRPQNGFFIDELADVVETDMLNAH